MSPEKMGEGKQGDEENISAWEKIHTSPEPEPVEDPSLWERMHTKPAEPDDRSLWEKMHPEDAAQREELSLWERINLDETVNAQERSKDIADNARELSRHGADQQGAEMGLAAADMTMRTVMSRPYTEYQWRASYAIPKETASEAIDVPQSEAPTPEHASDPMRKPEVPTNPHMTMEEWKRKYAPSERPSRVPDIIPAATGAPDLTTNPHLTLEEWKKKYSPTEAISPAAGDIAREQGRGALADTEIHSPTHTATSPEGVASAESMELAEKMRRAIAEHKSMLTERIPEKHRGFFEKFDSKLNALSEYWAKKNWKTKAAVGGTLLAVGIAGGATGFIPLVAGAYAGSRLLGFLGGYALVDALTKKKIRDTRTARWGRIGGGLAGAFAVPLIAQEAAAHLGPALQSGLHKMGIAPLFRDCFSSWCQSDIDNLLPPANNTDGIGANIEPPAADVTQPDTTADFAPSETSDRGGSIGEPSPEMAHYFSEPMTVKKGDSIWRLIEQKLGPNGSQAEVLRRVEFLKSLPPEQLKTMGIGPWVESMRGWLIHPGDVVDLKILDTLPLKGR